MITRTAQKTPIKLKHKWKDKNSPMNEHPILMASRDDMNRMFEFKKKFPSRLNIKKMEKGKDFFVEKSTVIQHYHIIH